MTFSLFIDNGSYIKEETFTVNFGMANNNEGEVIFTDEVSDGAYDEFGDWTSSSEAFFSAPVAMNDSPRGPYEDNSYNLLVTNPISIGDSVETAVLNFYTRWEIESGYDYVQVQVTDVNNFIEGLCGIHTTEGVGESNLLENLFIREVLAMIGYSKKWILVIMLDIPYGSISYWSQMAL